MCVCVWGNELGVLTDPTTGSVLKQGFQEIVVITVNARPMLPSRRGVGVEQPPPGWKVLMLIATVTIIKFLRPLFTELSSTAETDRIGGFQTVPRDL